MLTKQGNIKVKDFTYLTLKKEGKKIGPEMGVKRQILGWIEENVPDTKLTRELIPTESDVPAKSAYRRIRIKEITNNEKRLEKT